jgi:hypothetical protein
MVARRVGRLLAAGWLIGAGVASARADTVPLTDGQVMGGSVPAASALHSTQYSTFAPNGVAALAVSVQADQPLLLFIRFGQPVTLDGGQIVADVVSPSASANQVLTVDASSLPPVRQGTYFVGLANAGVATANFTLTSMVTLSGDACAGVVCTAPDACHLAGTCDVLTGTCSLPSLAPDGTACDDGDRCTAADACTAGACAGGPACVAPDQCHDPGACDPASGACAAAPAKPDGTTCDDGDACTLAACQGGACVGRPFDFDSVGAALAEDRTAECEAQRGVRALERRIGRIERLLARAGKAQRSKQRKRLRGKASHLLARARPRPRRAADSGALTAACAAAYTAAIDAATARLGCIGDTPASSTRDDQR